MISKGELSSNGPPVRGLGRLTVSARKATLSFTVTGASGMPNVRAPSLPSSVCTKLTAAPEC